jgi:hypothetical protein
VEEKTMEQTTKHRLVALCAALALAACGESGVEPPDAGLTPDEAFELALIEDAGTFGVAVELTDATHDVAAAFGTAGTTEGRALSAEARARLEAAREAALTGDRRRALEEARQARRLAAQALVATGGAEAVEALVERLEELALTLDADDDVFDDPEALRRKLERLAAQARELLERGHLVAAAERALFGEQLVR